MIKRCFFSRNCLKEIKEHSLVTFLLISENHRNRNTSLRLECYQVPFCSVQHVIIDRTAIRSKLSLCTQECLQGIFSSLFNPFLFEHISSRIQSQFTWSIDSRIPKNALHDCLQLTPAIGFLYWSWAISWTTRVISISGSSAKTSIDIQVPRNVLHDCLLLLKLLSL